MTFERRDIERAIAKAMGEKPGGKYLQEDTEDNRRFIAWGRSKLPKLDEEQQEVYDMISQVQGEEMALCSFLRVMDGYFK